MLSYKPGILLYLILFSATILSSCTKRESKFYQHLSKDDPHHLVYNGNYKVGGKYKVKKKTYTPKAVTSYTEIGMASWYGNKFHNKKTANGERFNKNCLTAAHRTLPMPSLIKVENLKNNKSVILLVNDRGPFTHSRLIDVSDKAASVLGFKSQGVAKVKVEYLKEETDKFLKKIGLAPNKGLKGTKSKELKKCSINCQVKLVNMKHGFAFDF